MQAFGADGRQTGVGVAQDQQCIGIQFSHQVIRSGNNIPYCLPQAVPYRIQINLRFTQLQIVKKYPVQAVVVVLTRVDQKRVKIFAAFFYHFRQADDLRPGTDDDHQLQSSVIAKSGQIIHNYTFSE